MSSRQYTVYLYVYNTNINDNVGDDIWYCHVISYYRDIISIYIDTSQYRRDVDSHFNIPSVYCDIYNNIIDIYMMMLS
jgi:hypothetical protein